MHGPPSRRALLCLGWAILSRLAARRRGVVRLSWSDVSGEASFPSVLTVVFVRLIVGVGHGRLVLLHDPPRNLPPAVNGGDPDNGDVAAGLSLAEVPQIKAEVGGGFAQTGYIVARYDGDRAVRTLFCAAQYQVMAFVSVGEAAGVVLQIA